MNLEKLVTHEHGFQLVTATKLQRAIMRMETGEPLEELSTLPEVIEAIGGLQALGMLPVGHAPAISVLMAAVRTAKSLKAAAKAYRAAHTANLDKLKDGEFARYSILSVDKDKANAVLEHLVGKTQASPLLRESIIKVVGDSVWVMREDGKAVEIKVMAGKRAGSSVVARWSAGCTLDEGPRMNGSEHVVNLPDILVNLPARLLPDTQIDIVGSPWGPSGPVYDMYVDHFGRPSEALLFMVAKGPDMNPLHFTPEMCARLLKEDPRAHRTDVLALFADPESSLLSSIDVEACTRAAPFDLEPNEQPCSAAIDPANRKNAWTLTIVRPRPDGSPQVVLTRQWQGSKSAPLMSSRVFGEIRPLLELYGIEDNLLWTDQASFEDKRELAAQQGIILAEDPFTDSEWRQHAMNLEKLVSQRAIELPPNAAMRADILGIQKHLTARSYTIVLPKTQDGRHGDYAPSLVLALKHLPSPVFIAAQSDMDENEKRICDFITSSKSNPVRHAAERLRSAFQ